MKKIEIEDLLGFTFLSSLCYSPDGAHAAFCAAKANKEDNKYNRDIYLINSESKKVTRLTSSGKSGSPIWWDNETIIFAEIRNEKDKKKTEEGEDLTVYQSISINGGEALPFLRFDLSVEEVIRLGNDKLALLYELPPKEKKTKEDKDYEVLEEVPFWFNGKGFISGKRQALGIYDLEKKTVTPVTNAPENVNSIKKDGNGVLFSSVTYTGCLPINSALKRYDLETGATQIIVPQDKMDVYFFDRWDGKIVFMGLYINSKYGINTNFSFFKVDENGITTILDDDSSPDSDVAGDCSLGGGEAIVLKNGSLYFTMVEGSVTSLRKIDLDMNSSYPLKGMHSLSFFDVSGDNILFCAMEANKHQEIYHLDSVSGKITQITNFNSEFDSEAAISIPERLNFTSDNTLIEGFVIKPVDFDPAKKYPCILDIHGGPKVAYGDIYFHEMQVWASLGYFVIFCNPRGGDGRGNEFADIRGKYGTIEFDDLMLFTDKAIEAYPQIDSSKMGVTGGSYGGFMTNWIIGHTDRFKAAVSQRSISNWISFANTSDIGFYFAEDQIGAGTWSNMEKLWQHSPLKYADKVKTPTLFIHSDNDYRCWMAEGLQMFYALKVHGVESRLCLFHGETHELSRSGKPLHRIRRLKEITSWFENHLK